MEKFYYVVCNKKEIKNILQITLNSFDDLTYTDIRDNLYKCLDNLKIKPLGILNKNERFMWFTSFDYEPSLKSIKQFLNNKSIIYKEKIITQDEFINIIGDSLTKGNWLKDICTYACYNKANKKYSNYYIDAYGNEFITKDNLRFINYGED